MTSAKRRQTDSGLPGGVNRRTFLKFCGLMAATLALPKSHASTIAAALACSVRTPVIWLAGSDCTGDSESLLRSFDPSFSSLILDVISLDYHESLMVPAGHGAEKSLNDTLKNYAGNYICVLEGAIPTANPGYCTIAGDSILNILRRVAGTARANIAVGACAVDGGIAAAAPNPTGATGFQGAVPGALNLINLPGCPVNGVNLVATIVYFLTYNRLPPLDSRRRPLFAYGHEIHHEGACERFPFYEADQFVRSWGDEGHKKGYCLMRMGCRGPITHANCYTRNWNQNTSWPIGAGHGCIGCTESRFWDRAASLYQPIDD